MEQYIPRTISDIDPRHSGGETQVQQPQDIQVCKNLSKKQKGKVRQSQLVDGNGKVKTKGKGKKYRQMNPQDKCKLESSKDGDA